MSRISALPRPEAPAPHLVHNWQHLHGSSASLAVAALAHAAADQLVLYLTRDTEDAIRVRQEIGFFAPDVKVVSFPDPETLPYDNFSPHQDIVSERLETLFELPSRRGGVLVVPVQSALMRVVPTSFVRAQSLILETGQNFDMAQQRQLLQHAGYQNVDTVVERGEYAVRGSLMDIFAMGAAEPLRIDLFDDEIESLRTFDPENQRTHERVDSVRILPAKEVPLDADGIARFRNSWHTTFDVDVRRVAVYQDVSNGIAPPGIEAFLPLFFEETASLFDYLPDQTIVVHDNDLEQIAEQFIATVHGRFESLAHDVEHPILPPHDLYLRADELAGRINPLGRVRLDRDAKRSRHKVDFSGKTLPDLSASPRSHDQASQLRRFLAAADAPVLLTAETQGRRQHLDEFLVRSDLLAHDVDDFETFLESDEKVCLTVAPLDRGFVLDGLIVVSETEVFGHRAESGERSQTRSGIDPELIVRNLTELTMGAPVVHLDHGVGRYHGLETLEIDGHPMEFLTLEYADESRLYVPVTSLHLIARYAGADVDNAPLHRLGSDQWEKAKRRAQEKVYDVAAELLDVYARREAATTVALKSPDEEYAAFCEQFPFEVTRDQQSAIDAVLDDLCSLKATDRLICGDVGFGKTEVAMRAAFIAVQSGKQVAVLVPTTLLAQQHFETFRDRFADWPVSIDVVSRLRTESDIKEVQSKLRRGKLDVLIGTHRLLSDHIDFKDLGLVVIDEEHRFGVRQKERLRKLRAEVDVLTLTATPIPRTLNMAMSGMRDLSIIATPPAKRLSIKTFVMEGRRQVTREAINRELARGGQVFYLHNEVQSIERVADQLRELVPDARIGVGHGQMAKRALESVMADFYHRRCNLLVCTTIIENGIDIPNANTIIIDRADRFGLAQLHQLRGRVGRSNRQAYAYLLTPHPKAVTRDARKRLDAIESSGELGIGFTLATHDLEIRGAGELLGDDQSGQIESVGFSLYMQMLESAVNAIRSGRTPNLDKPLETSREVNLHVPALIPEDYLPDVHMRLIMYKRIASAETAAELDELKIEMIDRFGLLPDALQALFRTTRIKLSSIGLGIERIDIGTASGRIEFSKTTVADPLALVQMVQHEPGTFQLQDATKLRIKKNLEHPDTRFQFVEGLMERLAPKDDGAVAAQA